jgi:hypothetical protein
VHCIFPALKGEEGMGSEGKEKKRIVIAKTTGFFGKGCAPFFLHVLRSTLLKRQRAVKLPFGVWKS